MRAFAHMLAGATITLIVLCVIYVVKYEALLPGRLMCGMTTADGCLVWVDKVRKERYEAGEAGT